MSGYIEEQKDRQRLTEINLYNHAVLIRSAVFAKRMPKFNAPTEKKKAMTDEEMYASVVALNTLFGGTES